LSYQLWKIIGINQTAYHFEGNFQQLPLLADLSEERTIGYGGPHPDFQGMQATSHKTGNDQEETIAIQSFFHFPLLEARKENCHYSMAPSKFHRKTRKNPPQCDHRRGFFRT